MEEKVEKVTEEVTKVDVSKPKQEAQDAIIKVDLTKPPTPKENETKEDNPVDEGVVAKPDNAEPTEKQEEVQQEVEAQETPVLEEVTEEEVQEQTEELAEEIVEAQETGKALPENLQKVVDFIDDTGGTLEDYVKLNQDYSELDNDTLLREYYKNTKPHLNQEEISFLMEDQFSYDEEADTEIEIKRKKLALKEQVASAKSHLDGQKSKYYDEIKAGSRLTPEQQKAMDFFNRYNKESEETQKIAEKGKEVFVQKTNQVFNDNFKGFDFNVGEKKYRYNIKNANNVKESQSDINNFVQKFIDKKNGLMKDAKGYHKSLFTAMNPDAVANHFYEQGKADAMKDSVAKAKNVSMNPRQSFSNDNTSGLKVRVLNDDTSNFKFKIKNK